MGLFDKARDFARGNPDKVEAALDKAPTPAPTPDAPDVPDAPDGTPTPDPDTSQHSRGPGD